MEDYFAMSGSKFLVVLVVMRVRNKIFNAILLTDGYSKQATYSTNIKYISYFGKYVKEAKMEKKGI